MPCQEDNRQGAVQASKAMLQFQSIESGHSHVEQYAARFVAQWTFQELVARFIERNLVAGSPKQTGNRRPKRRIVVYDVNDRRRSGHAGCALLSGSVKRNTAPPPGRFSAQT